MASARTQILNSMDIGLYSVFGQYDRKLLEEYDLFALDGSMGGGQFLNIFSIVIAFYFGTQHRKSMTQEVTQEKGDAE